MGVKLAKAFRWTKHYWKPLTPLAREIYTDMCVAALDYGTKARKGSGVPPAPATFTISRAELAMNYYGDEGSTSNLKRPIRELEKAKLIEPTVDHPKPGAAQRYRLLLAQRIAERDDIIAFLKERYTRKEDRELLETLIQRGNEGRQWS